MSEINALRTLLSDLTAGRMPPAAAIAEAVAAVAKHDRGRAEIDEYRASLKRPPTPEEEQETRAGLAAGTIRILLTRPQWENLRAMLVEPQPTFGKARTAVQNRLVVMGLAAFSEDRWKCLITDAGRAVVAAQTDGGGYRSSWVPRSPQTPAPSSDTLPR